MLRQRAHLVSHAHCRRHLHELGVGVTGHSVRNASSKLHNRLGMLPVRPQGVGHATRGLKPTALNNGATTGIKANLEALHHTQEELWEVAQHKFGHVFKGADSVLGRRAVIVNGKVGKRTTASQFLELTQRRVQVARLGRLVNHAEERDNGQHGPEFPQGLFRHGTVARRGLHPLSFGNNVEQARVGVSRLAGRQHRELETQEFEHLGPIVCQVVELNGIERIRALLLLMVGHCTDDLALARAHALAAFQHPTMELLFVLPRFFKSVNEAFLLHRRAARIAAKDNGVLFRSNGHVRHRVHKQRLLNNRRRAIRRTLSRCRCLVPSQ
eukprot:m.122627 g.122627  ORF g.122627 m.122627 type:complete len:326 (+) comp11114_c0_seq1:138-1115(+)